MFSGKTLLITGGTGTFGNAVLHRFLDTDIKEIRIFSRDEKKQEDMRIKLANAKLKVLMQRPRAALRLCDMVTAHLDRCPKRQAILGVRPEWVLEQVLLLQGQVAGE